MLLVAVAGFSASALADAVIARAQGQLLERGFDPGPVDGLMGPRTRSAIRKFQRDRGLPVNGRLDDATRNALAAPAAADAPAMVPDAGASPRPEVPEASPKTAEAVPPAGRSGLLSYQALGWETPQGGPDALDRFLHNAGSPEMARSTAELIVPRGDSVYVVAPNERIPGFDCDPLEGRIEMELMLGLGGPVVFRALDEQGYCKLGFGILLEVGQRIRILEASWGADTIPAGTVEVAPEGLRYLSTN